MRSLTDDEAYIVEFPVPIDDHSPIALRQLANTGLMRPGKVLAQSPFDPDLYEDAAEAQQKFALAKHMYFSTFCMHLGAREVVVDQLDYRKGSTSGSYKFGGERNGIGGQVGVKVGEAESLRTQMSLRDSFTGGPPDLDSAAALLMRTGLTSDANMRSLLELRRDGANKLLERTLSISLSSEVRSNLSVVARIKVPTFLKLSAEYGKAVKEELEFRLTVTVRF
tara:strand:+ start:12253 stop:12921 length:669 start_codon:yes stop_codon:yes gene_type:complete